jgi:hypothetical protein
MLLLVVAVEAFLARHPIEFGRPGFGEWAWGGEAARAKARGCAVLCLGDSLAKCDVLPAVLGPRLGGRAFNLGLVSSPIPAAYFQLRRALASGATPSAVVVAFHPASLQRPPGHSHVWGELLTPAEALDLAWACRDADLFARVMVGHYLRSLGSRHEIRANLMAALEGSPESLARAVRCVGMWRHWNRNLGATVLQGNPDAAAKDDRSDPLLFPPAWAPDPVEARYVDRLFALASARGIAVYWAIPPMAPHVEARRDQMGLSAAYDGFVRQVLARFPTVTVLDGRRSGYGLAAFGDPVHLGRRGAAAFSLDVAEAIARDRGHEPGGRWVALPPFADRSDDPRLEDHMESLAAAAQAGAGTVRR